MSEPVKPQNFDEYEILSIDCLIPIPLGSANDLCLVSYTNLAGHKQSILTIHPTIHCLIFPNVSLQMLQIRDYKTFCWIRSELIISCFLWLLSFFYLRKVLLSLISVHVFSEFKTLYPSFLKIGFKSSKLLKLSLFFIQFDLIAGFRLQESYPCDSKDEGRSTVHLWHQRS